MYRIVTVILISFICFVPSEAANGTATATCKTDTPIFKKSRNLMRSCFSSAVQAHLTGPVPGNCSNVTDFGKSIESYFAKVNQECNLTVSVTNFLQFVNFSLQNETYKEFYGDIECVKRMERNISECVSNKVGYFNITEKQKHSTWYDKTVLTYGGRNCDNARDVKACTLTVLSSCKNTTRQYVTSLFDFSLKNCNFTSPTGRPRNSASWKMSKPVLTTVITTSVLIGVVFVM